MTLPTPEPGLVIHFEYLWAREAAQGRESGAYARPCIILACTSLPNGGAKVLVAPITHSEPAAGEPALEIPATVRRRLGLDGDRSWVLLDELNEFEWPGCDIRQNSAGAFHYGFIPPALFTAVIAGLKAAAQASGLTKSVRKSFGR